jgi:DNA-binding NarL/FixJ family response regulator
MLSGLLTEPIGLEYIKRLKQEVKSLQHQTLVLAMHTKTKQLQELISAHCDRVIRPKIQNNMGIPDLHLEIR